MKNNSRDYYSVLGVEPNATTEQIKAMYHKLAKKYHADANSEDSELKKWSHEMMIELNEAYATLKDLDKRKQYDQQRNNSQSAGSGGYYASEIIHIETLEQGREILLDGMNHFQFGAPTPELEAASKEEMKKLLTKKNGKLLKNGYSQ